MAETYTKNLQAKGMRVVFVSSDRDEHAFNEYFGEMPWLALPYSDREKKQSLSSRYGVQGIPSFVILNPDGTTITKNGRDAVSQDPTGADYPWVPPSLHEMIGHSFVNAAKQSGITSQSHLAGKTVGLYFSAHWYCM